MRRILLFALLLCGGTLAQVSVQEDVVTDSVDVFTTVEQRSGKSTGLAMFSTILLPGLGHQYLDRQPRALTYFTTEALIVFGAILCESHSRRLFDDALAFAWKYARVEGSGNASEQFAQNLSYVQHSDDYNRIMDNNRDHELKYTDENLTWSWADESLMEEYAQKREWATTFHVASSFLIGTMVLNRVIAFVDLRASTRTKGVRAVSFQRLSPSVSPDLKSASIRLSATF